MTSTRSHFPAGHPFAKPLPVGLSPFEVGQLLIDHHRDNGFGGYTMTSTPPEGGGGGDGSGDDDDEDTDPDTIVRIGGRDFTVRDLSRIATREKRQGRRAGQKDLLKDLGVTTVEEAKTLLEAARAANGGGGDSGGGGNGGGGGGSDTTQADEASRRALAEAERIRREAEEDRRKSAARSRRADLRSALAEAGCPRDDLEDAFAILDRRVESEYDEDELVDVVEELKEQRPHLFGVTDDEADEAAAERERKQREQRRRIPAGNLPGGGRPPRPQPKPKEFGAEGKRRAEKRGWLKSDS